MNHNAIRQYLPDFVNEKLSDDLMKEVSEHLLICKECFAEIEQMKILFSRIDEEKVWSPSEQYFSALLPRIHQGMEQRKVFEVPQWIQRFALPLAAVLVMAVVFAQMFTVNKTTNNGELQSLLQQMSVDEIQQVSEVFLTIGDDTLDFAEQVSNSLLTNYLKLDTLNIGSVEYDVEEDLEQLSDEEASQLLALLEE